MENPADLLCGIPTAFKNSLETLQIGDAVEVHWPLLGSEPAIEITADSDVVRISGELTNMINVIADVLDFDSGGFGSRLTTRPARNHHPGIEDASDDGTA